jgi:hypothetical protein
LSRTYIKKTSRVFDVNADVKTQDEAIERANIVIVTLGFINVQSETIIIYGAETENKTIVL